MPSASKRRVRGLGVALVERIEPRIMLTVDVGALNAAYSYAETNWQSVLAGLAFSPAGPTIATAGSQITVVVTNPSTFLKIGVFCSYAGTTATVDGDTVSTTPVTSPLIYDFPDGSPSPDAGAEVTNIGQGTFTIVFNIRPEAVSEGITETTNSDGSLQSYSGPFVSIIGNDVGAIYSSSLPFAINNTNQLVFLTQPGNIPFGGTFSPPIQVAIENSSGQIYTDDNETPITILPDDLDTSEITGTTTLTTVDGVATFPGLADNSDNPFATELIASTQGIVLLPPEGAKSIGGLTAFSQSFKVGSSGGGGGGGGTGTLGGALSVKLPSSALAGGKVSISPSLTLTDTGGSVDGKVSAKLFLATGTTIDSDSILLPATSESLPVKLKAHAHATMKFKVSSLSASIPSGSYHVVAQIAVPGGSVIDAASGGTMTVAPAEIQLTGAFLKQPAPGKGGKTVLDFSVSNLGNVAASGALAFNIDTSSDQQVADATVVTRLTKPINIQPHKSTKITETVTLPAGSYFLLIQLDPHDKFHEVNPAESVLATGNEITV